MNSKAQAVNATSNDHPNQFKAEKHDMNKKTTCTFTLTILFPFVTHAQTFTEDFSDPSAFAERWISADGTSCSERTECQRGRFAQEDQVSLVWKAASSRNARRGSFHSAIQQFFRPATSQLSICSTGGTQQSSSQQTLGPGNAIEDVIVRTKVRVDTQTNAAIDFAVVCRRSLTTT